MLQLDFLTPQLELLKLRLEFSIFDIIHSFLHNFFIHTLNHAILVFMESPWPLESAHANEGDIEEITEEK